MQRHVSQATSLKLLAYMHVRVGNQDVLVTLAGDFHDAADGLDLDNSNRDT